MCSVTLRRRVDWEVLLGTEVPAPTIRDAASDASDLGIVAALAHLASLAHPDDVLRRAVELARERIGWARTAVFLVDEGEDCLLGTWGTDIDGRTVDEHHVMATVTGDVHHAFRQATTGRALWGVIENGPIVSHEGERSTVHGRGWSAYTPIICARRHLGMMFNDEGLSGKPVDPVKQAQGAMLATFLGVLLDKWRSETKEAKPSRAIGHPAIAAAVKLLDGDPSLPGAVLAKKQGMSLTRLVRAFKAELGVTLVDYRNQLRLERFFALTQSGQTNLSQAALDAGFGSYAQFHRVVRQRYGVSARELMKHGAPRR